jgi:hypothetical protein
VSASTEIARRPIVEARAIVAERGYQPPAEDIRALNHREKDEPRWKSLVQTIDFYSTSGCRDMFFNVMEHRLSIAEIKSFLDEQGFAFLGFELDAKIVDLFRQRNPAADALTDLDAWAAFEAENPQTFLNMYVFSMCRRGASAAATQ